MGLLIFLLIYVAGACGYAYCHVRLYPHFDEVILAGGSFFWPLSIPLLGVVWVIKQVIAKAEEDNKKAQK